MIIQAEVKNATEKYHKAAINRLPLLIPEGTEIFFGSLAMIIQYK